jgi:hypothetical protein
MTSQHIGAAGELLVQYLLLKHGIDSARMTTDSGIDLVVYTPGRSTAATVQVKANALAAPSGGSGKHAIGWNFPVSCPAQYLALTHLETDSAWILTIPEAEALAQQHRETVHRIHWYTDETVRSRGDRTVRRQSDMERYRLEARIPELFLPK